jgi:ABC-type transport system involved in multi-copper enzyme maturation permease subunit
MMRRLVHAVTVVVVLGANTVREALVGRVGLAVAAVAGLILVGGAALGALTLDDPALAVRHVGLAGVDAGGIAAALVLGVGLTARELEGGGAAIVLTRPVTRRQLVIGRWLGIQAVSALAVVVLSLVVLASLGSRRGPIDGALACQIWLDLVQALVVASLAVLAATLARPVPAGAFAIALTVIGRGLPGLRMLAHRAGGVGGRGVEIASLLLPNLYLYAPAEPPSGPYVFAATAYGIGYAALVVLVAAGAVRRRDFV